MDKQSPERLYKFLLKRAEEEKWKTKVLSTIHDSVVLELSSGEVGMVNKALDDFEKEDE